MKYDEEYETDTPIRALLNLEHLIGIVIRQKQEQVRHLEARQADYEAQRLVFEAQGYRS